MGERVEMTYCVVCSNLPKANDGRRSFLLVCGKEIEHVSGVGPDNKDAPPSMSSDIASLAHLTSPLVSPPSQPQAVMRVPERVKEKARLKKTTAYFPESL